MSNVDPFEHIRQMQLNKIRINNFKKWDVAKYDEFIMEGYSDYNRRKTKRRKSVKNNMNSQMLDSQE